tara:strand:- start:4780 stop:8097 length:3318 start_codon:yes stop_codon:yes gene_type:complete
MSVVETLEPIIINPNDSTRCDLLCRLKAVYSKGNISYVFDKDGKVHFNYDGNASVDVFFNNIPYKLETIHIGERRHKSFPDDPSIIGECTLYNSGKSGDLTISLFLRGTRGFSDSQDFFSQFLSVSVGTENTNTKISVKTSDDWSPQSMLPSISGYYIYNAGKTKCIVYEKPIEIDADNFKKIVKLQKPILPERAKGENEYLYYHPSTSTIPKKGSKKEEKCAKPRFLDKDPHKEDCDKPSDLNDDSPEEYEGVEGYETPGDAALLSIILLVLAFGFFKGIPLLPYESAKIFMKGFGSLIWMPVHLAYIWFGQVSAIFIFFWVFLFAYMMEQIRKMTAKKKKEDEEKKKQAEKLTVASPQPPTGTSPQPLTATQAQALLPPAQKPPLPPRPEIESTVVPPQSTVPPTDYDKVHPNLKHMNPKQMKELMKEFRSRNKDEEEFKFVEPQSTVSSEPTKKEELQNNPMFQRAQEQEAMLEEDSATQKKNLTGGAENYIPEELFERALTKPIPSICYILKLKNDVTKSSLKKAYFSAMKIIHPDKCSKTQEECNEVSKLINGQYEEALEILESGKELCSQEPNDEGQQVLPSTVVAKQLSKSQQRSSANAEEPNAEEPNVDEPKTSDKSINEDELRTKLCKWARKEAAKMDNFPIYNDDDVEAIFEKLGVLKEDMTEKEIKEYEDMKKLYERLKKDGDVCKTYSVAWMMYMDRIKNGIYTNDPNHHSYRVICTIAAVTLIGYVFYSLFGSPIKTKEAMKSGSSNTTFVDDNGEVICRNAIRTLGNGYPIDTCYRPVDLKKYILDEQLRNKFYKNYLELRKKERNAFDACTVAFQSLDKRIDMKKNYKLTRVDKNGNTQDIVEIKACDFYQVFFGDGEPKVCKTETLPPDDTQDIRSGSGGFSLFGFGKKSEAELAEEQRVAGPPSLFGFGRKSEEELAEEQRVAGPTDKSSKNAKQFNKSMNKAQKKAQKTNAASPQEEVEEDIGEEEVVEEKGNWWSRMINNDDDEGDELELADEEDELEIDLADEENLDKIKSSTKMSKQMSKSMKKAQKKASKQELENDDLEDDADDELYELEDEKAIKKAQQKASKQMAKNMKKMQKAAKEQEQE